MEIKESLTTTIFVMTKSIKTTTKNKVDNWSRKVGWWFWLDFMSTWNLLSYFVLMYQFSVFQYSKLWNLHNTHNLSKIFKKTYQVHSFMTKLKGDDDCHRKKKSSHTSAFLS